MMRYPFSFTLLAGLLMAAACAPQPAGPVDSGFVTEYLAPTRIVSVSGPVDNAEHLLKPYVGQVSTDEPDVTTFEKGGYVLLDFGKEIQGGLQLVRNIGGSKSVLFRIVLGESVTEALSNVDAPETTATNDHAIRDFELALPWLGCVEVGNSGFRFARVELVDGDGDDVSLVTVRAISKYRDVPYLGSFRCSDDRLNQIWQTSAYTVHLCMQDYLWDGIKRDRLVWMGDMHPEIMTVNTVFGNQAVVRKSLDYVRDKTAPTDWMNGICSYSLWWIILQHHLYAWYGDMDYLKEQVPYMKELLKTVEANLEQTGNGRVVEAYRDGRFIDWPSNDQPEVIHAGLQALSAWAFSAAAEIGLWLGDEAMWLHYGQLSSWLAWEKTDAVGNSQAAALLYLACDMPGDEACDIIRKNGPERFTSFMGYYLLEALAKGGHYAEAMQLISDYWGRMLDLGATTFWEDFNYNDAKNAGRIDEIVPEGKFDIHADGGAWCYVGLRHSFCHGWASGPTAWLSRHVLGVVPVEPGFRKVMIDPNLGDLTWAEGAFPTPYGLIEVKHRKNPDGSVTSEVKLPKGIKRVKDPGPLK